MQRYKCTFNESSQVMVIFLFTKHNDARLSILAHIVANKLCEQNSYVLCSKDCKTLSRYIVFLSLFCVFVSFFFSTSRNKISGMKCKLVNIHKSNVYYCTISTTYIDNRKARSKNLKGNWICKGIAYSLCLTREWLFYNRYKYTYMYKLNTISVLNWIKVSWCLTPFLRTGPNCPSHE